MADGNETAAHFILDTTWDSLPETVRQKARILLLDDLGAVIGGTLTPVSKITAGYAAERMQGKEATILLQGKSSTAPGAAMANAYAGNGLDIDDGSTYTRGHPGVQVMPAALAVAEKLEASGRELLEALVVGYEVALLTGRCWHDHHEIYQACGSWGSVACAAVAARLMKLDKEKVNQALGIAEYHAPNLPMMRDIDNPAMVKHGTGWGAMNGIVSAELAERGFTGIPGILGFEKYNKWVSALGREYLLLKGVSLKRWCSCGWGHPALAAAEKLLSENRIKAANIANVKVYTFHQAWRLWQQAPETTEEAQFSVKWPLAAFLIDGEVGPEQILEPRLGDPEIRDLAARIEIIEELEINRRFQLAHRGIDSAEACWSSRVVMTLKDGRRLDSSLVVDDYEWDQAKTEKKFRRLTAHVLEEEEIEYLLAMIRSFEEIPSVKDLTRRLQ